MQKHVVSRKPGCPVAGGRSRHDRGALGPARQSAHGPRHRAFSSIAGLKSRCRLIFSPPCSPISISDPRRGRGLNAGKGRTEEEAKRSALGEAVERYAAYHLDPRRVSTGPAAPGAIMPADCVLYSEAQYAQNGFPFRPWTPDAEISWVGGTDLHSGEASLPAALVHLVYPMPRPRTISGGDMNGLSAGPTLARATWAASTR